MSLVAVTPVGSGRPDSSAASTPTLSAPCAYTPTSSMSSRPMIACSDRRPILPVVHWMTRKGLLIGRNLHVRAAVDADLCSGDEIGVRRGEHRDNRGDGVRFGEHSAVVERQHWGDLAEQREVRV